MENSKYPRTLHLDFSPEIHSDDKVINMNDFNNNLLNKEIILTEKYDGENSCLKPGEGVFARSHSAPNFNPWSDWLKKQYYDKLYLLNENYWYFGENLYAIHSIKYDNLDTYFYIFHIYDKINKIWLSFEDMKEEAERVGFKTVKVIFKGVFKTSKELEKFLLVEIKKPSALGKEKEGFVLRTAGSFKKEEFSKHMAKYVRKGHVQTDKHWRENWKIAPLKKD